MLFLLLEETHVTVEFARAGCVRVTKATDFLGLGVCLFEVDLGVVVPHADNAVAVAPGGLALRDQILQA